MTLEQTLLELQNSEPEVRERACRWRRMIGGPEAVAALIPGKACAR
jgi:hypothetical protein